MVKQIELTRGKFAIVDDDDYEEVSRYSWHCTSHGYASRVNPETKKREYLHRFLMQPKGEQFVDHINRDKLDCRRSNLRLCTRKENVWNSKGIDGTSKYKGVHYKEGRKKPWRARINFEGNEEILGDYLTEQEAAHAFNIRARELHGEFAYLNEVHVENFIPFTPRKTSSTFKGVNWCNTKKRWRAKININGKITHIGYFRKEEDAGNAYIEKAKELAI